MFTTGTYLHIRDAIGDWAAFNPNPIWGTANPTISSTVARYVRTGNIVTFDATIIISDGGTPDYAVLESLDLPVPATQVANRYVPLSSFKSITLGGNTIPSDPKAYIDFTEATPKIKFRQFGTLRTGYSGIVNVSGSYEVA
jgi:hypothetical protein